MKPFITSLFATAAFHHPHQPKPYYIQNNNKISKIPPLYTSISNNNNQKDQDHDETSLRLCERQCRLKRICYEIIQDDSCAYRDEEEEIKNPISKPVPFDLDELPAKIRYSYDILNYLWNNMMDYGIATIKKYSFRLDDDESVEPMEVLSVEAWNDGGCWLALYDAKTYQYLITLDDDCTAPGNLSRMEEAFNKLRKDSEYYGLQGIYEKDEEEYERLEQKLNEADTYELTSSDQLRDLLSIVNAKCDCHNS